MMQEFYHFMTEISAPVLTWYLKKRLKAGREDRVRFGERLGLTEQKRPDGPLVWCHAASVGEALSLLIIIESLKTHRPNYTFLITTGTVSSARLLEQRLGERCLHQYVPVDRRLYIDRFLDFWRPNQILWVESELWPNMLEAIKHRSLPLLLLNGRMSLNSYRNWLWVRSWAQQLLAAFDYCLTQSEDEAERYKSLGAKTVLALGNIKYAATPLPADATKLIEFKSQIGSRIVWVLASSHEGEEELAFLAHKKLKAEWPQLITIIVPRHSERGASIKERGLHHGLSLLRRSENKPLTESSECYIADTMGELGLFYRVAPVVVMGGSLLNFGGHNPIEPAHFGPAIVLGPYMKNFAQITKDFLKSEAAYQLKAGENLAAVLAYLMRNELQRKRYAERALKLIEDNHAVLDKTVDLISSWMDDRGSKAA